MASIVLYTRNILESATVTVPGQDDGFPAARLRDRAISLYWSWSANGDLHITVDQGSDPAPVDFLAAGRHNFSGRQISWQYSSDGFASDIHDAVSPWTQPDGKLVVKHLAAPVTSRWWRLVVAAAESPRCGEVFMAAGRGFDVKTMPAPVAGDKDNVAWTPTVGGLERACKLGDPRRMREYGLRLSPAEQAEFAAAMAELDGYSKPFFILDHKGECFLCRLQDVPESVEDHKTHARINLAVIEML